MFYGLDLSEIETYRDRVDRVTPADIQRVAKQFLKPDQLSIVLVGDASDVRRSAQGARASPSSSAFRSSQLDLNSPTLRRAGRQPGRSPDPRQ